MSEPGSQPGEHLTEEPQEERGEVGSRDKGAEPAGGPTDRPAGQSGGGDATGLGPSEPIQEDMPQQPSGDQGG
jgi:hypothetical protein